MKRPTLLILALALGACARIHEVPPRPVDDPQASPVVESTVGTAYRYNRVVERHDTLFVWKGTPDRMMAWCYVYHRGELRYIEVQDYAGQTTANLLDFRPKIYHIPVSNDYIDFARRYAAH
ncbi:MAG TPA: hypothetical protein PK916_08915 [Bacteroidota bacterium]|nr:hypothetical protein [Bacteroidota bacterium]